MEETKDLLRRLLAEIGDEETGTGLHGDLKRLRRTWQRLGLLALVAVVGVAVAGAVLLARTSGVAHQAKDAVDAVRADSAAHNAREDAIAKCIETWANDYTSRARAVQTLGADRLDALFAAFDAADRGHMKQARALFREAQAADRRYHRYLASHPVPALRLSCKVAPAPNPRPTHSSGTPTTRPTATVTHTVALPGPTVTIHAAGPVVTRTAPARTVTVTVPPGKARRRP